MRIPGLFDPFPVGALPGMQGNPALRPLNLDLSTAGTATPHFGGQGPGFMDMLRNPAFQDLMMQGPDASGQPQQGSIGMAPPGVLVPDISGLLQPYQPPQLTPVSFGGMFG